jgi:hypothetical protein
MGLGFRFGTGCWAALLACGGGGGQNVPALSYIYTQAARYDSGATLNGGERFPASAVLQLVSNGRKRELVAGFAGSADAAVSFDGRRALFSGKQKTSDPWQIWEVALNGGAPRRITAGAEDAIAPFYLPADRIVCARRTPTGFQLVSMALSGGDTLQLTYGPGNHVASDVLRDGRILFEAPHPGGAGSGRDIFTVYPDGTGVETYRCDHGRDRNAAREVSSGDIVFESAGRLGRFTSARAIETDVPLPTGESAGPIAEISAGRWLVSFRTDPKAPFALYRWHGNDAPPEKIAEIAGAQALQPVLVRSRPAPRRFPSALRERPGANLLCLNAYTSRLAIAAGSVSAARVWALDDRGAPVMLGQAPVERDGSFYVQAPGERAIRFELLDRSGKTVAAEKGWFWARRGEQRVCVGCHAGPERAPENTAPETLLRSAEPVELMLPIHSVQGGSR